MRRKRESTFPCPHCGEVVRATAKACRACGSDATTGWGADAAADSIDLPESDLPEEDYREVLRREGLGPPRPRARRGIGLLVLLGAAILLALYLLRRVGSGS